ncbi:MAG: type II toxin-antitoxin system HicB family antitoxin, partial [Acidobacteria bacterium]|nr:type II toxin-antitoxin system HicB family antitoxin [Acidobacteriota bacterium]
PHERIEPWRTVTRRPSRKVGDWWTGYVEELPGCNVQEQTLEEAGTSLKEVIRLILEANRELARRESEGHQVIREEVAVPVS